MIGMMNDNEPDKIPHWIAILFIGILSVGICSAYHNDDDDEDQDDYNGDEIEGYLSCELIIAV